MFNEEFLTGLLGNKELSAEDITKQIISEHEATLRTETQGLVNKRDELLGEVTKLKEQNTSYEKTGGEKDSKIKELSDLLEKANAGDKRAEEYYNTKLAEMEKKHSEALDKVTKERDSYFQKHLASLEDKAFEAGLKDLNFVPGLKEGFVALVRSNNHFEPIDVKKDGNWKFLNAEGHTIEEVIKAFSLTPEGKAYIANPSTGGGARGDTCAVANDKTMTREQFNKMQAEDPAKVSEFFAKGGRIVN